jgi:hypothetical protein
MTFVAGPAHPNISSGRFIAGGLRFFTLIQLGDRPAQ